MKRFILSLLVAAGGIAGAYAHAVTIGGAPSFDDATLQNTLQTEASAPVNGPLKLEKIEASHAKVQQRAEQPNADWGDWTLFDSGTFYHYAYEVNGFFFDPAEAHINVYRREDRNNQGYAQLKFQGVFGGRSTDGSETYDPIDLIFDEAPDGSLTSEAQFTHIPSRYYPTYPYEYYGINKTTIADGFKTKRPFYIPVFLLVDETLGFQTQRATYVSDNYVEPVYSFKWSKSQYTSKDTKGSLAYNFVTGVTKMRYYLSKTVPAHIVDGQRVYYYSELANKECQLEYSVVSGEGTLEIPFDQGPGTYYVNVALFDDDDDLIQSGYLSRTSNIPDNHSWQDIGQGWFAPVFLTSCLEVNKSLEMKLVPEISLDGYTVRLQRAADAPNLMRIVDPYGSGSPFDGLDLVQATYGVDDTGYIDDIYTIDHSDDYYIVIDTADPDRMYVLDRPDGLYARLGYKVQPQENSYLLGSGFIPLVCRDGIYRDAGYFEFMLKMPGAAEPSVKLTDTRHSVTRASQKIYTRLSVSADVQMVHVMAVTDEQAADPTLAAKIVAGEFDSAISTTVTQPDFKWYNDIETATTVSHQNIAIVGTDWKNEIIASEVCSVDTYNPADFTEASVTVELRDPLFSLLTGKDIVFSETVYLDPKHPEAFMVNLFGNDSYKVNVEGGALAYDPVTGDNPLIVSVDANGDAWLHTLETGVYYSSYRTSFLDSTYDYNIIKGVQGTDGEGRRTITFSDLYVGIDSYGYYADQQLIITFPKESGVEDVTTDADDTVAPVYYDMQGRRVENPSHGLYIEVRGTTARKLRL